MLNWLQNLNAVLILPKRERNFVKSTLQWKQQILFGNGVKMYQFKEKYSELINYPVFLVNISKYFSVINAGTGISKVAS